MPRKPTPPPSTTPSETTDVLDQYSLVGLSHEWLGFFTITLTFKTGEEHDLSVKRAMLIEWLQTRYGIAYHTTPNAIEEADAQRLSVIAQKLLLDFNAYIAEFKDTRTGDFAREIR